jgi:hypothetical protein
MTMGVYLGFPGNSELFDKFEKDVRELKKGKTFPQRGKVARLQP